MRSVMPPSTVLLVGSMLVGAVLCVSPQQQQQQPQQVQPQLQAKVSSTTAASKPILATTTSAPPKASSESTNLQSSGATFFGPAGELAGDMDTFDGRNPFADDSLWRLPINLVRDLSGGADERLGKSATSNDALKSAPKSAPVNELDDNDDDDDLSDLFPMNVATGSQMRPSSSSSAPTVISASTTDLKTAAGYHHSTHGYGHEHAGHHGPHHYDGKYFQYASVPYPYAWESGYRRGNPYHTIERYEHAKGPYFKAKVKWSDKYAGHGVHIFDYNHDDHHSHHYAGGHHDSYSGHAPAAHYGAGHHHYAGHH